MNYTRWCKTEAKNANAVTVIYVEFIESEKYMQKCNEVCILLTKLCKNNYIL